MDKETQTTLRDAISASFEQIEAGTPNEVKEQPRDEEGKFTTEQPVESKEEQLQESQEDSVQQEPAIPRPSTWKKEYLPIWDKISSGLPLEADEAKKLAAYTQQRETEYKTGVSTYKAEAEKAKELQSALEPFMPELHQYGINPKDWIASLGQTHRTFALGTPEQKLNEFVKLARDFGVPLQAIMQQASGQQQDPMTLQLLQEIQNLKSQVGTVSGWREQQEEREIQNEISRMDDAEKYPHFPMVRGVMAQLLESGQANDLDTAYQLAVEPIEAMIEQRLAQVQPHQQSSKQQVAQAKAKAVSPRSASPSGVMPKTTDAKDRRALLAELVDSTMGGRV